MNAYRDEQGRLVRVRQGLGNDPVFMAMREGEKPWNGHRVKSRELPLRRTAEEAQRDLDAYAAKKGWVTA